MKSFLDVLIFKDIRIRNPTIQILKGNKIKKHYSFSDILCLQEDLIIIYDWDDKLHTYLIREENGVVKLMDMEYDRLKNFDIKCKVKYNTILNVVKQIYS